MVTTFVENKRTGQTKVGVPAFASKQLGLNETDKADGEIAVDEDGELCFKIRRLRR
ncbi:hypothetical protein [Candidatus Methanoperedens nitratireducens]|uniref:SpoVT-AbrB domain-containing protein n=1 Tax=Candidatus Methanoperedens nitratireducens TaxID=1392998 RepID=A0A284VNS7_9EURY|nr:hypothetical protein [Candidatus Methanoperedens nitroreducens]SNQ60869.1 hypothetical protein MNV_2060011 [Candidatus Methanoperedens nitroreducens]